MKSSKKNILILLLTGLLIASAFACARTGKKVIDGRIVFEDQKISFAQLPIRWGEEDPGASDFYFAYVYREACIRVKAYKAGKELSTFPKESLYKWFKRMVREYNWQDFSVVDEGWTKISGEKAYWTLTRLNYEGRSGREKIYRIFRKGVMYQFRLSAFEEYFADNLSDFENWIKKVEFL